VARRSYGLNVARMAGIDEGLIELAARKSRELEEKCLGRPPQVPPSAAADAAFVCSAGSFVAHHERQATGMVSPQRLHMPTLDVPHPLFPPAHVCLRRSSAPLSQSRVLVAGPSAVDSWLRLNVPPST
jgi:hypothetical protein